jgi:hypothetical protein
MGTCTYTLSHAQTEYFRLSDGFYKAVCIGRDRIRVTWIKEDWDDDNNIAYSIGQWTVTEEHYKKNFTADMICSRDRYVSLVNEIQGLL